MHLVLGDGESNNGEQDDEDETATSSHEDESISQDLEEGADG